MRLWDMSMQPTLERLRRSRPLAYNSTTNMNNKASLHKPHRAISPRPMSLTRSDLQPSLSRRRHAAYIVYCSQPYRDVVDNATAPCASRSARDCSGLHKSRITISKNICIQQPNTTHDAALPLTLCDKHTTLSTLHHKPRRN